MTLSQNKYPNNADTTSLLEAILTLQTPDEASRFLRDLLTEPEILELSARLKAARMLNNGVRYVDVQKSTGLSSATVARVARWLQSGLGGYRLVLDRLNHHHTDPSLQEAVS